MSSLYKTWLPNTSGHLSLRHIGGISHSRNQDESLRPFDSQQPMWRSFMQVRTLSERPGIGSNRHPEAKYAFLFQAEIQEHGATQLTETLQGMVYAFPVQYKAYLDKLHLVPYDQVPLEASKLLQEVREAEDALKLSLIAVRFSLEINGFLTLESLHSTTEFEANPTSSDISYGQQNTFEIFAFLRDAFHKHRFHSARDDYVLEPYRVENEQDATWIGKVARSLHRAVISGYRGNDESMCAQALGKLAYLEAFLATTKQRGFEADLPALSVDTLRAAICATKQEMSDRAKDLGQRKQMLIAALAIFIPFFFVLLQLLQLPCIEGLNYDYKPAVAATAHAAATDASGNCSNVKFHVSPQFLDMVGFVLKHLDRVMVIGAVLALMTALLVYRKVWLPRLRVWVLTKAPTLYRFAVAEPVKAMLLVGVLFIASSALGVFLVVKLLPAGAI